MDSLSQGLWAHYWHLAGHISELRDARDYVRLEVGGEEVVLFNDGRDIVAFDNRCPHRGARIFDGSGGNTPFLCRYHGWSYAKGKVFVADKQQFGHCDLSAARLATLKLERLGDFLFVSASPQHSLSEQLGGLAETVKAISLSIDRRRDFDSYGYDCHWPIAVENALEAYHVPAIHPQSLNQLELADGRFERHGANSVWFTEVGNTKTANRLGKLLKMFDVGFAHPGYVNIHLFPFSMISSTFGLSYSVQNFFPGRDEATSYFYSRLFAAKLKPVHKPQLFDDFFASTAELNRKVFREDNEICARVARSAWSIDPPQLYARSEERIVYFREACTAANR